jgi:hypothetical protein
MRYFVIEWSKKNQSNKRKNKISINKPTGEIGYDAKSALNIFCGQFGGLNKNEVYSIQEVNEEGDNIGEPIVPLENTNIIPTKK